MTTNEATVFVKVSGYDEYFKVEYTISQSARGYKIARVKSSEQITKAAYYKQAPQIRFIRHGIADPGCDYIHEVGNSAFFERINEICGNH